MIRTTYAVILLVTLLGGTGSGTAVSADESDATPDVGRIAFGLPAKASGVLIANDYGLSLNADELSQLREDDARIERAHALAFAASSDSAGFGGIWYDRSSRELRIQYVQASSLAPLRSIATRLVPGDPYTFEPVEYPAASLAMTAEAISRSGDLASIVVVEVDVPSNRVHVGLAPWANRAVAERLRTSYGAQVSITDGQMVDTMSCGIRSNCGPPYKAGLEIWSPDAGGAHCTAAFVYQNASKGGQGPKGKVLTTAGHCGPSGYTGSTWYHGNPAVAIGSVYQNSNATNTNADVMYIDISDTAGSNDLYQLYDRNEGVGQLINITSRGCANEVTGSSCELVGQTVCYSGLATGQRCSTIKSINVTLQDDHGIIKLHQRTANNNTSAGGDSGAPVYVSSKAWGHFWGGTGGSGSFWAYSHIWYVADYCSQTTTCNVQIVN